MIGMKKSKKFKNSKSTGKPVDTGLYDSQVCPYCKSRNIKVSGVESSIDKHGRCSNCVVNSYGKGKDECVIVYDTNTEILPTEKMNRNNRRWANYFKYKKILVSAINTNPRKRK